MKPELVDPIQWESIEKHIDKDYGMGITKSLMGNLVPIVIDDGKSQSFYLVPQKWSNMIEEGFGDFDVKLLGTWLGEMSKQKLRLSLPILEKLAELTDNTLIVSKQGAQVFTYGKSILKEGVVSLKPSLKRKQRVIVKDQQGNVLGLAQLMIDAFMRHRIGKEKLVAKNLVDIGWYIRRLG